jgi:Putative Flp pilus-assembly TadE/G-like
MLRDRGGSERGSVAIVVALSLTLLLAFAALVVDVGLNWAARTSAQTAADSAALAGASTLLLDGPAAAFDTVETFLSNNQVTPPAAAGWADDGVVSNGEVVCWTMPNAPPDPPPGPGLNCPDGSNALQVITPPINVQYAFAPILGRASNSIKATAAAGAGPAAPNNCVLCLLEPNLPNGLAVTSDGGVDVDGGGIVVNSAHATAAAVLSGGGDVRANQIRVIGGVDDDPGGGQFSPPPELGGPTVADPLADLRAPDPLALPCCSGPQLIVSDTTLRQGVFDSISVSGDATLTLQPGVYVLTDPPGLSITDNGSVVGNGVTIYLACSGYPAPCAGPGAPLSLTLDGQYLASAPTSGEYAGLTIFSDRGNTAPMVVANNAGLNLNGALYAASAPLTLTSSPGLRVDGLLVVGTLLLDGDGPIDVNYKPSVLLPGVGGPVLIR